MVDNHVCCDNLEELNKLNAYSPKKLMREVLIADDLL